MSNPFALFDWWPGRRAAVQRKVQTRRAALAGLGLATAELDHELKRLTELSHTTAQDDAGAISRETAATARILEVLERGERLTADLGDEGARAWRRLAADASRARLLGQGPHRVAKLQAASAECAALHRLVEEELAGLESLPDKRRRGG